MRRIALVVIVLVAVACLATVFPGPASAADRPANRVVAMYFHRTERCPTCLKMGSYAEEAVKTGFVPGLKDGTVEFYYIDFQDPKNAKLTQAYGVSGPSLIVAKVVDHKVKQLQNLKEIWTKVADKPAFLKYVQDQIAAAATPPDRVVAMYFHRTQRCPTCLKMGAYSEEAVKQLKDGKVEFHYIDFQDRKNASIAKNYGVDGPSLIVAKIVDNQVAEFTNLEDIWTKVGDKPAFLSYVKENLTVYREQIVQKPAAKPKAS